MKKTFLFLLLGFTCSGVYAQDRAAKFDSLFSKLHQEDKFSGNVLIAENGKPIFQKSYGLAFREKGEALNSESVFELASVGKQFTAMAIMILKKQGKLSYDDSLRKFFPELPYYNITIKHLLNHTSGLPDYLDLAAQYWDSSKIMRNKEMIQLLADKKPAMLFAPGEKWDYSNTGYALLGSIIEKVSGQSFGRFMADNIYKPLGMNRSLVYQKRLEQRIIPNYAYGYVKDDSRGYIMADSSAEVKSLVYSMDGIYGDGITNSTTPDLLKWDQALYTEKLVSKKMMEEAFSPGKLNNGANTEYGFGWFLRDNKDFGRSHFHSGGWPGYITWIERFPNSNKTVIILANAGNAMSKIKSIRHILFNIEEKEPTEIKLDEKILQQYTGHYKLTEADTIVVQLENGKLFAEGARQARHQLFPEATDIFFRKGSDYKTQFVKNSTGKVTLIRILRETGPAIEAVKVEKKKTLLAIFPHPDDESAIAEVLIKYARLGYHVQLVIATDGKDGTRVTNIPAGDSLGTLRKEETRCACRIMGIAPPIFLGIERLDTKIGVGKYFKEHKRYIDTLKKLLPIIDPSFIITFGPDGDTRHAEHIVAGTGITQLLLQEGWVDKHPLYYVAWTKEQAEVFDLAHMDMQYANVKIDYSQEIETKALEIMPCYVTQYKPEELKKDRESKLADTTNTIHFRRFVVKSGIQDGF